VDSPIEELWLAGELADDDFEDHFIDDLIAADIGEGTDGWESPDASYSVELRRQPLRRVRLLRQGVPA
jgi:hypothetical protein